MSDDELLAAVREAQDGIRDAMARIDALASERNGIAVELIERGHSMRSVAKVAEVSPQALHTGIARMRDRS
jgi:hypothetical protein